MSMRSLAVRLTFLISSLAGTAFSLAQDMPAGTPGSGSALPATSAPGSTVPSAPASGGDADVENLYDQIDQQSDQAAKKEETVAPSAQEEKAKDTPQAPVQKLPEAKSITELNQLQPFSDIAVIQRRYLPKTHRFEFSAIGQTNLNNPFFNNFGGSAKIAYYLTEQYAIEAIGTGLSVSSRQVTDDLKTSPGGSISTSNTVTARSFFGAAFKWNPIYGKVSFLNRSIVPFDLNFSFGGGLTQTDHGFSEPTVHLGTSQVFAWSKSFGIRWDIDWNFYSAHATDISSGQQTRVFNNDLYIGIGFSFYFPGATYR